MTLTNPVVTSPGNIISPDEAIAKINSFLGVQRRSVFDLGEFLIELQDQYSDSEFLKVAEASGLRSRSNAYNYMRVARWLPLKEPHIFKNLPTAAGSLFLLASWEREELETCISEGVMHPSVPREVLKKWKERYDCRNTVDPHQVKEVDPEEAILVGRITIPNSLWNDAKKANLLQLSRMLSEELDLEGICVSLTEDPRPMSANERRHVIYTKMIHAFHKFDCFATDGVLISFWDENGNLKYDELFDKLEDVAEVIANADYADVHDYLRFSSADWQSLGVSHITEQTLTPFFSKEPQEPLRSALV